MATPALPAHVAIAPLAAIGVLAFVTTRAAGSFGIPEFGDDPMAIGRWQELQRALVPLGAPCLASSKQVHGKRVLQHTGDWEGWLRVEDADGHVMLTSGAAAISIADCVPIFIAHPGGGVAIVHAGWRGVADGILPEAIRVCAARGMPADELVVHLGPSICGRCYQVGTDVYEQLTGFATTRPRHVDLRALLADQAKQLGVVQWSASGECTKCDNDQFFSHRAGDAGRQVACIARQHRPTASPDPLMGLMGARLMGARLDTESSVP